MLSSTNEYLQALRQGNYLLFLEWPQFVAEHQKTLGGGKDADDLLDLLINECQTHGFSEDDVKKIALLNAVYALDPTPVRGCLAYALTVITGAVLQNGLRDGIIKQLEQFDDWVRDVSPDEVGMACLQISAVGQLRQSAEEYMLYLDSASLCDDQLKIARSSVVKRLATYLNEQSQLTAEVADQIRMYVQKIREMQPALFEDAFLTQLSPPSLMDNTWRRMTEWGLGLFNVLQKPSQEKPLNDGFIQSKPV